MYYFHIRIKMKESGEKTESQKIEKLLERTLNDHFDRMMILLDKRDRTNRNSNSLIPDAKYQPTKYSPKHSPEPVRQKLPPRRMTGGMTKGKPPAVPFNKT